MILRTRLPFLCNMATTTCKPAEEPALPLARTVPENVQSRDTFSTPTLTPERFRRHLFEMPTMQPQHAVTAAGKSEIMRRL
jgi:hypothetical protein